VPKEYLAQGVTPEVKAALDAALKVYEGLGCSIEECSLPTTDAALAVYYIIAPSEASANLARYDGVKYGFSYKDTDSMWQAMEKTRAIGFGPEVKRRIMLGTYALSAGYYDAWYVKAQRVRTVIRREFDTAFEKFDALITPTAPTVPFKIGEKAADPFSMYLSDICTIPVNIAGLPGISIQGGFANNLPIGLQIIAKPFAEKTILKLGHAFQQSTDWHKRLPKI
jgi:aspartyl-tRNA(Asn)/glutamyl-tRNA(Gln) amidotransferase subunit A